MRIIIRCGNPECEEEYYADTGDRDWECPHCGRERPNKYYPFLTAKLMDAKIHSREADWRRHHDELLLEARRRAGGLREHMEDLRKDLGKLRVRLPDEERASYDEEAAEAQVSGFLEGWEPGDPGDDARAWRDLHDRLLEGAREEILALEEVVVRMEAMVRKMRSDLNLA